MAHPGTMMAQPEAVAAHSVVVQTVLLIWV
jgi:hypothetical protein